MIRKSQLYTLSDRLLAKGIWLFPYPSQEQDLLPNPQLYLDRTQERISRYIYLFIAKLPTPGTSVSALTNLPNWETIIPLPMTTGRDLLIHNLWLTFAQPTADILADAALQIIRNIRVVKVNEPTTDLALQSPFGGFKQSSAQARIAKSL